MDEKLYAVLGFIAALVVTKAWEHIASSKDKEEKRDDEEKDELRKEVKGLRNEIREFDKHLHALKLLFERIEKRIEILPKLDKDVNALWHKIRLSQKVEAPGEGD